MTRASSTSPPRSAQLSGPRQRDAGREGGKVALRLAIGRQGIGIELAHPARVGCVSITELTATLRDVRFPVDVSGGVTRFRHRRGTLQRLQLELSRRSIEKWAAPRLRGIVSQGAPNVWVDIGPERAAVCISAEADPGDDRHFASPAVAFDVHVIMEDESLSFVTTNARGAHLAAPAAALAMACMKALLGPNAVRNGALFSFRDPAGTLARAILPEVGARVPATKGLRWSSLLARGDTCFLRGELNAIPLTPSHEALRAREIATVLAHADDALFDGDFDRARMDYVDALERAPRHPEIVRRVVDIDARVPGREEAALGMFSDAWPNGTERLLCGFARSELLAATGDEASAAASFEREGRAESVPVLSARAYERAATLAVDPEDAGRWLDEAIARAPGATTARWHRVAVRLELGRPDDALADVGHLEACAGGPAGKHAVWVRAGRAWQRAGLRTRAGAIFERALRYAPDDAEALAGLGESFVRDGAIARGVSALARALKVAGQEGQHRTQAAIAVTLGRAMAEHMDDLPTAVAHVASVPVDADEAPMARGLEGRWRARLGDIVGASLAFARLREAALSAISAGPSASHRPSEETPSVVAALLREAADFESTTRCDLLAAQRHLAAALRLRPHDEEIRQAHRRLGARIASPTPSALIASAGPAYNASSAHAALNDGLPSSADAVRPPEGTSAVFANAMSDALAADITDENADLVARAEELARRVQLNPADDGVADELAEVLEQLGRRHELLALLLGRLEDAKPDRRGVLLPRVRGTLRRLEDAAKGAGRPDEAALYRDALNAVVT